MRRISSGAWHSAALTDDGKLYTWYENELAYKLEQSGASGLIYPLPPDLGGLTGAFSRPRCVEAFAGMRIVSLSASVQYN
jgi:hypothetical protein